MDTSPPTEEQKVAGGVELEVEYSDGRKERILVRYLRPVKDRERYLAVLNDEAASIELFCGREKGWAETLTVGSFDEVADKGQELNLPFFRNWYRRLMARSEAIKPGLVEKAIQKALDIASENLNPA